MSNLDWGYRCARVVLTNTDWPSFFFVLTYRIDDAAMLGFEARSRAVSFGDTPDLDETIVDNVSITTRRLREMPFGELDKVARSFIAESNIAKLDHESLLELPGQRIDTSIQEEFKPRQRPGRKGRPDLYYVNIAERYVSWLAYNMLVKDLAEDLSVSVSALNTAIKEARRRGFLTAAPPGKAGGELTPTAIELLGNSANRARPKKPRKTEQQRK